MYDDVLDDILAHNHTHYVFAGGRGSTKSSFISMVIPLLMIQNPKTHAVIFRKVAGTLKTSVFAQMLWGIEQLGLSHYFKSTSVPMKITYLPTGQQILFFGLDDASKVKSVKLPFGYIGITWFEELDQYSGENELRKVTQSTMRGGDKFWDFRSFNPPISNMNWANKYAIEAEFRNNTLVTRNTYLDVPRDWLGAEFFNEAEDLKETNERAYRHEYLGEAVGTGGNVFENVVPMKMSDELVQSFDRIYNGIDWGWYPDPFAFVKVHYDAARRDLYIFNEYRCFKKGNKEVYNILYNERKLMSSDELLTADSAEPKSVSDFRDYGARIRGAEKGPDSVNYSMKWLQSLKHIYIDGARCPETLQEFIAYEYDRDKDDNVISGYPDYDNHSIDAVRYALEKVWKRKGQ